MYAVPHCQADPLWKYSWVAICWGKTAARRMEPSPLSPSQTPATHFGPALHTLSSARYQPGGGAV